MGNGTRNPVKKCRKNHLMPIWKFSAVSDRRNIANHIAKDNPAAAVEIVDLLIKTAGMLGANPKMGRAGRMKGTREAVAHPNYILGRHHCRCGRCADCRHAPATLILFQQLLLWERL